MSVSASTSALAKLEPYLLLAKAAKGAAAAKLILEATASTGCYVFSELLEVDNIKELENNEQYQPYYRILLLFAYGDLTQYYSQQPPDDYFPPLSPEHITKLRQLTLVSLASKNRVISYSTLIEALKLKGTDNNNDTTSQPSSSSTSTTQVPSHLSAKNIRALEDLIIDAIYAGLLSARLDQRKQRIEVNSVMGRDVNGAEEIGRMSVALHEWSTTTTQLLSSLSSRIEYARRSDENKARTKTQQDDQLRTALTQIAHAPPSAGGGLGGAFGGAGSSGMSKSAYDRMGSDRVMGEMDMEDDLSGARKKKSSARGPMRLKRSRA